MRAPVLSPRHWAWRGLGRAALWAFVALAFVEAIATPSAWLRTLVYVISAPISISVATAIYLEREQRSWVSLAALLLAGVGAVVLEGIADDMQVQSVEHLPGIGGLAARLLVACLEERQ